MDKLISLERKDKLGFSTQNCIFNGVYVGCKNVVSANIKEDFYVSYLPYDMNYESDTTALVIGQMEHFYILNGDHRKEYSALLPQGKDVCLDYFKRNISQINKMSEKIM